MKHWKKLLCVLCLIACLSALVPTAAAVDDTVFVSKHVSMLFDSSGSMQALTDTNNVRHTYLKWTYASYAAQAFAGLLNDTDTLSVTFMDHTTTEVDLKGDRQAAVSDLMQRTSVADDSTPGSSIDTALGVLKERGLKSKDDSGARNSGEEYWLVLTTDGTFEKKKEDKKFDTDVHYSEEELANILKGFLGEYPDLKVVYFSIGTEGTEDTVVDLTDNKTLKDDYADGQRFTAVHAQDQEGIISGMQELSNLIATRYKVEKGKTVSGNTVTLEIDGKTPPIRNIAVLAQKTNAEIIQAVTSDGTPLKIDRSAKINFPQNSDYQNVPEGTLGGYTALISTENKAKIPTGTVTLTFSEAVSENDLTLMFEPAIFVKLQVERKNAAGEWEEVTPTSKIYEGDELRVSYGICEEGAEDAMEQDMVETFFGKVDGNITYDGQQITVGESFRVTEGEHKLTVEVKMLDGNYRVGTSRTIRATRPQASDFTVTVSEPLTFERDALKENTEHGITFTVECDGQPVSAEQMKDFKLTAEGIDGKTASPAANAVSFTPKDKSCEAGEYTVSLSYIGEVVAEETITVIPNPPAYSAQAGGGITIMSNVVATNDRSVEFTVTAHTDDGDRPITKEESELFRVEASGAAALQGKTEFKGGKIVFTPQDANATVGDYTVSLLQDKEVMAQAPVAILQHNAEYTIDVFTPDGTRVNLFEIRKNEANVTFVIYADGVPVTGNQLEAMLGDGTISFAYDPQPWYMILEPEIGEYSGKTALICTPTARRGLIRGFVRNVALTIKSFAGTEESLDMTLKVNAHNSAEKSTSLTMWINPAVVASMLLLLIILGVILVLFGMFLWANLCASRMRKGVVYLYEVRPPVGPGDQCLHIDDKKAKSVGANWKLRLFPWVESVVIGDTTFYADGSRRRRGRNTRVYPSLKIKGEKSVLEKNYRHSSEPVDKRIVLLKHLLGKDTGMLPIMVNENGRTVNLKLVLQDLHKDTPLKLGVVCETDDRKKAAGSKKRRGKSRKRKKKGGAKAAPVVETVTQLLTGTDNMVGVVSFSGSYNLVVQKIEENDTKRFRIWSYVDNEQARARRRR